MIDCSVESSSFHLYDRIDRADIDSKFPSIDYLDDALASYDIMLLLL